MNLAQFLPDLNFNIGNYSITPSFIQAGAIIFLVFVLFLTLASVRRHFIDWSLKGAVFGIFIGFLIALVLEGFLIIGGKTVVTEILGWKDAPKPVVNALDAGRDKLVKVLGVTDEIPESVASQNPNSDYALEIFQSLDPTEAKKVKSLICAP